MALIVVHDGDARATLTERVEYVLEWRAEAFYKSGCQFELRMDRQRPYKHWQFEQIEAEGADIVWRKPQAPTNAQRRAMGPVRPILRGRVQYGLTRGQTVRIRLRCIPPHEADLDARMTMWVAPLVGMQEREPEPDDWTREDESTCSLPVRANTVERLCLHARPLADDAGQVRVTLVPYDRTGNPTAFRKDVTVTMHWEGREWHETVRDSQIITLPKAKGIARVVATVALAELACDENIANGAWVDGMAVVESNPVWPECLDDLRPGFGEFHWHTNCSGDGGREIRDSLRWARDACNMDFCASSDHNTGNHPKGPFYPGDGMWEKTVDALEDFNEDGVFATFFGWENSSPFGHDNYYFTDPNHPVRSGGEAGVKDGHPAPDNVEVLREHTGFFAAAHHTNVLAETRTSRDNLPVWQGYSWPEPQEYFRLLEIFQIRGNSERNFYSDVWRAWHQGNNASFQDGLAAGHKLGIIGGTDNHSGWPSKAFVPHEGPALHPAHSQILTGVWMTALERQEVFDALYARHTWAVWDTRAIVHFTVNGALMGDEIALPPDTPLRARIRMSAEAPYQSVEIVSAGESVWCAAFHDKDIDVTVDLGVLQEACYLYLRAVLRNGGLIYASPVFITPADAPSRGSHE